MKRLLHLFAVLALLSLLLPALPARAATANLIANASLETSSGTPAQPTDWQSDHWGQNDATLSYATEGYAGTHSALARITTWSSGDAKWYFAPVAVSPGATYLFSDFYKADTGTDVVARFTDASGAFSYRWLTTAPTSSAWQQVSTSITVPSSAVSLTVLHILSGVGSLQTDEFSLTAAPQPGQNVVPNAGVETPDSTGTAPLGWQHGQSRVNTPAFSYLSTGHTGSRSVQVKISSYTSGDAYWTYPAQQATGGATYEFSDYYRANVTTYVYAQVTMADRSQQWLYVGQAVHTNGWNKFDQQFVAPAGAVQVRVYHSLSAKGYLITDDYDLHQYVPQGYARGMVSITFDDALRSTYTNGLPIMQKYGFATTQYMLSGMTNDPNYMTVAMMRAMRDAGEEIASHTVNHPHLPDITQTQLTYQLSQSKSDLQKKLGVTPTDFASPYGEYNAETLTSIKKYYRSHRSTDVGFNSRDNFDIYNIKVQNVIATTTTAQIADWVNQAKTQHTWLVLVYHAVDPDVASAGTWDTTPSDLDAQFAAIASNGIAVRTVSQALDEISAQ